MIARRRQIGVCGGALATRSHGWPAAGWVSRWGRCERLLCCWHRGETLPPRVAPWREESCGVAGAVADEIKSCSKSIGCDCWLCGLGSHGLFSEIHWRGLPVHVGFLLGPARGKQTLPSIGSSSFSLNVNRSMSHPRLLHGFDCFQPLEWRPFFLC